MPYPPPLPVPLPAKALPFRQRLAALARPAAPVRQGAITFGLAELDGWLGGGLLRGALHEVFAAGQADVAAATGFAALLALRAARQRRILWVRQDFLDGPTGQLHPPGLAALGLNPPLVVRERAGDVMGVLRAAAEASQPVWIGYVDQHGATSERVVRPLRVEAGRLTAYDERSDEERSFALHRITQAATVSRHPL
jgi:protein ImuA